MQDGFRIEKLGDGPASTTRDTSDLPAGIDLSTEPLGLVNTMPAVDFFSYAARLLKRHPVHPTDGSIIARLKRIGIVPGEDFDATQFASEQLGITLRLYAPKASAITGEWKPSPVTPAA